MDNSSDNGATSAASPQQFEEQTHKEKVHFMQVDKDKVLFRDKLDALAKMYSRCILGKSIFSHNSFLPIRLTIDKTCNMLFIIIYATANLVPNVTAELYFVIQLLTARGIVLEQQQDGENGNKTIYLYRQ